jgi:subtilisin family serine protease
MRTRFAIVALVIAAGTSSSLAAAGGLLDGLVVPNNAPVTFVSRPGVQELTRKMIVRPVQPDSWLLQGLTPDQATARATEGRARLQGSVIRSYPEVDEFVISVPKGLTEDQVAAALMSTGLYEYVEPDWLCYQVVIPNDPKYGSQWQLAKLQAPAAWDITTGSDVILAITDSGLTHPDFNTVAGWNIPSNNGTTTDVNGHGTFCAGMAGAKGNNGVGVVGAGWNFRIMPVRVTNNGNGSASMSDILNGGRWAVDHGAKSISASYTGVQNASVQTTGAYIKGKGGLYLYAAGNDGSKLNGGDHKDVIIVGATSSTDFRASFSNYGDLIDVTGPGYNVYSTVRPNSYGGGSGTSFSTPLASGVIGMIWSANPDLTAQEVEEVLFESCKDIGTPGEDSTYGHGRVDLLNAVTMAGTSTGIPVPFLEEFPTTEFDTEVWTNIQGGPTITNIALSEPSAPYSMAITTVGTISTRRFDLEPGDPPVTVSFWTQHRFVEQFKTLKVEYYHTDDGAWKSLKNIISDGNDQASFERTDFAVPPEAMGTSFRLRFTAVGGDGGDLWFVDDVSVGGPSCLPDLNGDGELDLFDFLEFQNLFLGNDPLGDWNDDGLYDLFDFLAYQNSFAGGC